MTIEKIERGMVYAFSKNGESTIYTIDGAVAVSINSSNQLTFDPPRVNLPGGEIQVGMKWVSSSLQTNAKGSGGGQRTDEFKVLAFEEITIPAGKFKTYKISMNSWVNSIRVENFYWYLPDWGVAIKSTRSVYPRYGNPTLETTEIESFSRGKSSSS